MKKSILFLVLFIFLLNIVLAEDLTCQYQEIEQQKIENCYLSQEAPAKTYDEVLNIYEFNDDRSTKTTSFKIYNPLKFPITVRVNFETTINQHLSRTIDIDPENFGIVDSIKCCQNGECSVCSVKKDSVEYTILSPYKITLKCGFMTKNVRICKKCGSWECLDDNETCQIDSECGSGICNIAHVCGKVKVVPCPEKELNCNNINCFKPSSLRAGKAYLCEWQCESGKGENGVCKYGSKEIIFFLSIIFLIFAISIYFIIKSIITKGIIKKANKKAEKIIKESKERAKKINEEVIKKENEIKEKYEEIFKLESKLKNLNLREKETENIEKELLRKKQEIEKLKEVVEKQPNDLLNTYEKIYGHSFILENGYIRFAKSWLNPFQKGEFFHIWWYKQYYGKIKPGNVIHHKDFNKLNNDINNLEELSPWEHEMIHRNRHK